MYCFFELRTADKTFYYVKQYGPLAEAVKYLSVVVMISSQGGLSQTGAPQSRGSEYSPTLLRRLRNEMSSS